MGNQSPVIRVVVADDRVELRRNYRRLLRFEEDFAIVGEAGDGRAALELARTTRPDVVLMDVSMPVLDGIAATEAITAELPATAVVVVSVQSEEGYVRRAMKAGARDYLIKPFDNDQLVEALRAAHAHAVRRRGLSPPPLGAMAQDRGGRVLALVGAAGGVGTTTLALNLGVAAARRGAGTVCVVDLDLQFGDVAVLLNVVPRVTLLDLTGRPAPWSAADLTSVLVQGPVANMMALLAPPRPEHVELLTAEHVTGALAVLRGMADLVILDLPASLRSVELAALDAADRVALVTALELPAIKSARLRLELLRQLGFERQRLCVLLNQTRPPAAGIRPEDAAASLRHDLVGSLPYGGIEFIEAANRGEPYLVRPRTGPFVDGLVGLLPHLLGPGVRPGSSSLDAGVPGRLVAA